MLTSIPFGVSNGDSSKHGEAWDGGFLPDTLKRGFMGTEVPTIESQQVEGGGAGKRSGMAAPALLTRCANWVQPLLPRPQLPFMQDKGVDSGESKGPASSDIPGFLLFSSAFNSPSSPIFHMVKN